MLVVYKYPVANTARLELEMPRGARILTVQEQRGGAQLWALVDPDKVTERREFLLRGTGHPIAQKEENLKYVGTFQLNGGYFIGHLFEVLLSEGGEDVGTESGSGPAGG